MNENSPTTGLDPTGFLIGGFIAFGILGFQEASLFQWVFLLPTLTVLFGLPSAVVIYAEARKAYTAGFLAGMDAANDKPPMN